MSSSDNRPAMAAEVVVVGGGIIGLSIADELAARGRQVVVLERDVIGRAASWAGGGILSPLPPGSCPPLLQPLLDDSLQRYPEWCAGLQARSSVDPEYWVCGGRYVSTAGVQQLPDLAQVRNPRLLRALAGSLKARGVRVIEGVDVLDWQRDGDHLTGVATTRGTWSCEQAVLAAGAWSGGLGGLPVRPVKGQMLLLAGAPGQLGEILIGDAVYLVPRRDGQMLIGSTLEEAGFDTTPTEAARNWLLQQAAVLWPPAARLPVIRQWAGLRPAPEGELPLIGPQAGIRGLFNCTAHFRIGITLAPGSAALVASLLCGERPRINSAPFAR